MERLWAPWRMAYIEVKQPAGCIFCEKPKSGDDREQLILYRDNRCFIMMNLFPYNNGHLMVAPYRHTSDLVGLEPNEQAEMMTLTRYCVRVLTEAFGPDAFNIGMNLGRVAGAGVADHLHMHVVPRWNGDTNFMPVLAETKVLPDALHGTFDRLSEVIRSLGRLHRRKSMSDQFSLFDDNLEPAPRGHPAPTAKAEETPDTDARALAPPAEGPLTDGEKAERLDSVRRVALECTRCGLSRTRTNVVFGEGNPAAPLVFVGEGPGENEDATGRPFVGRAGKLLDEVLLRNGMTRAHVYICNVVKCRAANMEGGRWLNRQPEAEEIAACQPWLAEQLGIVRPLVIVCVGAPAANTIIHKGFRITSERGRWFTTSPYAGWTMAVFHPAYVLRLDGPAYQAALETLVEDVGKARQKVIEVKRQLRDAAVAPARSLFD